MAQPRQCPKCQGAMSEGFVADKDSGSFSVSAWIEGEPAKSIWTGLKLRGRTRIDVTTWRCRRCGFLESYAHSE